MNDNETPDYGPSGYLPDRAAKRARKIILRAQMGIHWVWGAVVLGVGVLIVGTIFLFTKGGPPGAPYVAIGPVSQTVEGPMDGGGSPDDGAAEYLATTSGRLRIFHIPSEIFPITWCEETRQFEGDAGSWTATGRGRGGVESLVEHPTVIVDDILYWDPTRTLEAPTPDNLVVEQACQVGATG